MAGNFQPAQLIAHEYFGLDGTILWDVIQTQVPALAEQFQNLSIE